MSDLLTPKWNAYIRHVPTPHQHAALILNPWLEILYGGAAGGGKSDFLLMAALQYVDHPNYNALLCRRTYPMLAQPGGLIGRSKEWLSGTDAVWKESEMRWTFPSNAILQFGHMQYEDNKLNYQSAEFQFVGLDETTHFSSTQYTYMFSRLRRCIDSNIPVRMRGASNPGGVGHDWVRERFLLDTHPDRLFIPAKLDDNPHLDRLEYLRSLEHLHPFDREQLLLGNWDARPMGARFKREWFGIVDEAPAAVSKRVRAWDLAATPPEDGSDPDYTAGVRVSRYGDTYFIEDVIRARTTPQGVDALMLQAAKLDHMYGSIQAVEQEPGASGKIAIAHFQKLLTQYGVKAIPARGDKFIRSNALASAAEAGNVKLVRGPWNEPFLREMEMFAPKCSYNDQVDGAAHAYNECAIGMTWDDLYPAPPPQVEIQ